MTSLRFLRRSVGGALLAASAFAPATLVAQAREPGLARLEQQFADIARTIPGTVGVAAVHLETGRAAYLNRGVSFPMASTFKVPVAVELFSRVDRGTLRMDSLVTVQPTDLHPGSGTLTELFNQPGVILSVRNLTELMLRISDNSATDILLRTAGGGATVNGRLRALGVSGISVDRPTVRLIADYVGIRNLPSDDTPIAEFGRLSRGVTPEQRAQAVRDFFNDPRDQSTPEGMALLLEKIWKRQGLSESSAALLLDIMYRCTTGAERLKGMLPIGTRVAHKTGSLAPSPGIPNGVVVNDVGIIDLPQGAGHVIVAAFVKNASDAAASEKVVAHVARSAYDYFTQNPGGATLTGAPRN